MAAPVSMPERVAGRVSWPDGEFRASESVAVSGRLASARAFPRAGPSWPGWPSGPAAGHGEPPA